MTRLTPDSWRLRRLRSVALVAALGLAGACGSAEDKPLSETGADELSAPPEAAPPTPRLRRLTVPQYKNALLDLFGEELVVPTQLEPDLRDAGLQSVGASSTAISPRGVEQYEAAAFEVARQVLELDSARAPWFSCVPTGPDDSACAAEILGSIGRRAWRRSLSTAELGLVTELAAVIAEEDDSFDTGMVYGLAYLLQAPAFIYREELGAELDGRQELMPTELASRLSFLLWNTIPDEELLAAAEDGSLDTDEGLREQAERLLASPRAREGMARFFTELLELDLLDDVSKDPLIYHQFSPDLGPVARAETLHVLDKIIFEDDADWRTFLTTRTVFPDRRLSAIYGIPAPSLGAQAETVLPADGPRRGFLGSASYLMLNAHSVSTSVTLRGKFVREVLLCQTMPAPPGDVDTSIPEPDENAPTMRDRVAVHLEEDSCASCHQLMDPIGLGFENFDALGRHRLTENGVTIDPSGELDGVPFADEWELARTVAEHEALGPCLSRHLYSYAVGHDVDEGEEEAVAWLGEAFAHDGYRVQSLMLRMIESPAFRQVGDLP